MHVIILHVHTLALQASPMFAESLVFQVKAKLIVIVNTSVQETELGSPGFKDEEQTSSMATMCLKTVQVKMRVR